MRGNIPKGESCRVKTETTEIFCVCFSIDNRTGKDYCRLYDVFIRDFIKTDECKEEKPKIMAATRKTASAESGTQEQKNIQPKKRGRKKRIKLGDE